MLHKAYNSIEGWLFWGEALTLYDLAKKCPKDCCIVEIGSFKGKSTCCLALGSMEGNRSQVFSIDPHRGSPDIFKLLNCKSIDTYSTFLENLETFKVSEIVTSIRMTSKEASCTFSTPIGLLFIDGRHEFEFVQEDFNLWAPKIAVGGIIAFHDCTESSGPQKVVDHLIQMPNYKLIETVLSLSILEKIP